MKFEVKEIKLMNGEKVDVVVEFYKGYSHIGPTEGGWTVYHNRKTVGWINYEAMEILKRLPSDPNDYQPLIDYQNGWDAGKNSIFDEAIVSVEAEAKIMEEEKFAATVLEAANLQVQGPCSYESEEDKAGFCKTTSVEEDAEDLDYEWEQKECHDDDDTESSGCCGGGCHTDSAVPVKPSAMTSDESSVDRYLQEACDLIYGQSGIKNLELWNETMKSILYKTIKKISDLKEK